MRAMALLLLAGVLGGCTTVKLTQRNGCWVRETHKTLHGTQEDVGPCTRPPPKWSEDRLTRIVQECVAQADYRWEVRALAAWNLREPLPPQDSQETVIKTCMNEAAVGVVGENETLRQRLSDVSSDRETFRTDAAAGTEHLRRTEGRLAEYLGEAAKRPPPVATATASATSDGTASTENGVTADAAGSGTAPAGGPVAPLPVVAPAAQPAAPEPRPADANAGPAAAPSDAGADAAKKPPAAKARKTEALRAARKRALARAAKRAGCEAPVPDRAGGVVCPAQQSGAPEPAAPVAGGGR